MRFTVSDESINSYGFRVLTAGIDTSQFDKNPVMLYDHDDWRHLPIGTWENLAKNETGEMLADPAFDEEDDFAARIKKKVDKGVIRMASIGIIPLEWSDAPEDMLPGQKEPTIVRSILREISVCPFGSNRNAFKLYDTDGNEIKLHEATKQFKSNKKEQLSMEKTQLKELLSTIQPLKLNSGMSEPEIFSAVLSLSQRNQQLEQENKDLQKKLDDNAKSVELKEKEALINKAVEDKRILASAKEAYLKLSTAELKTVLEAIPKPQNLSEFTKDGEDTSKKGRETWTFSDYTKKDSAALLEMKEKNPEQYKQLFKAEYGVEPKN